MLPGPDRVIACPHCQHLAKHFTLASGNTFGATLWSDGYQLAPMLPQPPSVVWCGGCDRAYWLSDAPKVGEVTLDWAEPFWQDGPAADPAEDDRFRGVRDVEEPTVAQYAAAIADGLARTPEEMRRARVLAWWRANDPFRKPGAPPTDVPASDEALRLENLAALLPLLNGDDPGTVVMRAETLRELGRFEEALDTLDRVADPQRGWAVDALRRFCLARDRRVQRLQQD